MADAMRLFGMRAVVTSAASGIGEAIVRTLVKQGAEVLAVDSQNSGIDSHFKSVRGVRGASLDIHSPDAATSLAELAASELGVVDIVICNLSLRAEAPLDDTETEALDRLLSRKAALVQSLCDELLPMMKSSPAGRIVLLGFNRSVFGEAGSSAFERAEAELATQTRQLAAATGEFGINVNYIQPGAVMTPDSRRVFKNNTALRDYCIAQSAAKRLGEPVDVAKVALFLATDDSVFVSGTGVRVDGGAAATSA